MVFVRGLGLFLFRWLRFEREFFGEMVRLCGFCDFVWGRWGFGVGLYWFWEWIVFVRVYCIMLVSARDVRYGRVRFVVGVSFFSRDFFVNYLLVYYCSDVISLFLL